MHSEQRRERHGCGAGNSRADLMMQSPRPMSAPTSNELLRALPREELARLLPHLHQVLLAAGDVTAYSLDRLSSAYFPTTCVISLVSGTREGETSEIATVGDDGVLGTSLFLGSGKTINTAVVALAGLAYRLDARVLREEFARSPWFQRNLLRYTEALLAQISLTAACNCCHSLEKRFCRWLLLTHDRAHCNELAMTQENLAQLLGRRRESVTIAAGHLQDAGLIHYSRGRILIVDRAGLERSVCDCYRAVKSEFKRILVNAEEVQPTPVVRHFLPERRPVIGVPTLRPVPASSLVGNLRRSAQ